MTAAVGYSTATTTPPPGQFDVPTTSLTEHYAGPHSQFQSNRLLGVVSSTGVCAFGSYFAASGSGEEATPTLHWGRTRRTLTTGPNPSPAASSATGRSGGGQRAGQRVDRGSFTGGADGGDPYAGVIPDSAGNFYGTTAGGGAAGIVYKLDVTGHETVLHSFTGGADGPGVAESQCGAQLRHSSSD